MSTQNEILFRMTKNNLVLREFYVSLYWDISGFALIISYFVLQYLIFIEKEIICCSKNKYDGKQTISKFDNGEDELISVRFTLNSNLCVGATPSLLPPPSLPL